MKKSILLFGFSALFLASCGGGEENTEETAGTEETIVDETCTYSYDPAETVLTWTAFKRTDKVGVNGTFDEINVTANDGSEDVFGTLVGATFNIPVSSLNSQDEVRDPKIKNSFFGVMNETAEINGSIKALDANKGTVEITMNGIAVEYEGDVTVEGEEITLLTTIDMVDFDAQASVDSLGVVCEEKHTGSDGVNKLWTDVDIAVKTTLVKTCN